MESQRSGLVSLILILVIIALLVGIVWANYKFGVSLNSGIDFLPRWIGIRDLIIDGISPYSEQTTQKVQQTRYGHTALPGQDEMRFAYPLHSAFIYTPYALIPDFELARALWMLTLEVALVATAFISLRLTKWRLSGWMLVVFLLISIFWYHALRPLINGNVIILVALFIVGALLSMMFGRDQLAGFLLALSTIKPQVVILIIPFIIIWAVSVRRWKVVIWFVLSTVVLTVSVMIFIPDWPLQNIREMMEYSSYNPPGTPTAVLIAWWPGFGEIFGWTLTIFIVFILVFEWFLSLGKGFSWFLWTGSLTLALTPWIGVPTDPRNYLVLFVPIVLIFSVWERRLGIRFLRIVELLTILVLFLGLWALFIALVGYNEPPLRLSIQFFLLPALVAICLYWIRSWAIRSSAG